MPINLGKKKNLHLYFHRKNPFALQIERIREKKTFNWKFENRSAKQCLIFQTIFHKTNLIALQIRKILTGNFFQRAGES